MVTEKTGPVYFAGVTISISSSESISYPLKVFLAWSTLKKGAFFSADCFPMTEFLIGVNLDAPNTLDVFCYEPAKVITLGLSDKLYAEA